MLLLGWQNGECVRRHDMLEARLKHSTAAVLIWLCMTASRHYPVFITEKVAWIGSVKVGGD